jgi:GxxExxY protein
MAMESDKQKIPYETQVKIPVYYKDQKLNKEFIVDYIGYEKIIVEFKCIPKLTKIEEAQIINYLKATRKQVGLLINFGNQNALEWKRYVRTK